MFGSSDEEEEDFEFKVVAQSPSPKAAAEEKPIYEEDPVLAMLMASAEGEGDAPTPEPEASAPEGEEAQAQERLAFGERPLDDEHVVLMKQALRSRDEPGLLPAVSSVEALAGRTALAAVLEHGKDAARLDALSFANVARVLTEALRCAFEQDDFRNASCYMTARPCSAPRGLCS